MTDPHPGADPKAPPRFRDKRGIEIPASKREIYDACLADLENTYGITPIQIAECAGFSMAMVVRFALGLSSSGGDVVVLIREGTSARAALAAARHLRNSGSRVRVVLLTPRDQLSANTAALLRPLELCGSEVSDYLRHQQAGELEGLFLGCHNIISGLSVLDQPDFPERAPMAEILNEMRTPVHAIECPAGIDCDSGEQMPGALYASSTLSLGLPLSGLHAGRDFVGRHYLCDISFPHAQYQKIGLTDRVLFDEQPVIQIYPVDSSDA